MTFETCVVGESLKNSEKKQVFSVRPDNPMAQTGLSALTADRIIRSVRPDYPGQAVFSFL